MGRKEGASRTCFPFLRFFRAASWRLFSNSGSVSALSCSGSWGGGTQRAAKERNGRKGRRSSKASQQRVRGLRAQGTCVARAHAVLPRLCSPTPFCACSARMRARGGRGSAVGRGMAIAWVAGFGSTSSSRPRRAACWVPSPVTRFFEGGRVSQTLDRVPKTLSDST